MFKTNLFRKMNPTLGLYAKFYKGSAYLYVDGSLVDQNFEILGSELSLTKAAKLITNYSTINGRSWWKKIEKSDLKDETIQKLEEMGLLETHQ